MNKKLIIGAIVAVIAIGGVTLVVTKKNDNPESKPPAQSTATQTNATANKNAAESGNIYSLTDAGKARKCTFQYSGTNGTGSGTMYTDGKGRGLMAVDIKTDQGNTGTSNTLVLSDKVYGWTTTNGTTIGFMYNKATLTTGSNSAAGSSSSATADPNQRFDLKCDSWNVDESVLIVPQNVNFLSLPTGQ